MLNVHPIPAFNDNYLWLIQAPASAQAFVVDPGDPAPVLAYLENHGLQLSGILITHHHADHTGGIKSLLQNKTVPVYGPDSANIPLVSHRLKQGDSIEVLGTRFEILEIPGHTLDHIAYFNAEGAPPLLFCGDTLFAGGCGRVFEGTAGMMYESLQKLAALPPQTRVYCAHEYTLANLSFARAVSPGDEALAQRIKEEEAKRQAGRPTVPTSIALELDTNPFLRCGAESIKAAAHAHGAVNTGNPIEVFAAIRGWKDRF